MKKLCLLALIVIPFLALQSQDPVPMVPALDSGRYTERHQRRSPRRAADPSHRTKTLVIFQRFVFARAPRSDGTPELHATQADVFFVQSGSATLIVGGTLSTPK